MHKEQAGSAVCNEKDDRASDTCDKGNTVVQLDVEYVYISLCFRSAVRLLL